MSPVTRADVVAEARTWLDTPYAHQGRKKGLACDCAGLPLGVAHALGLIPPDADVRGYSRRPDGASLLAACDRWMTRIAPAAVQPGDVLVMRFELDPQHLGIVGDYVHGGLSLIHALGQVDGRGRVVEHRLSDSRIRNAVAAYVLPGVA